MVIHADTQYRLFTWSGDSRRVMKEQDTAGETIIITAITVNGSVSYSPLEGAEYFCIRYMFFTRIVLLLLICAFDDAP